MAAYLRLRQVCLVAADLERAAARLSEALGVAECYRDPNVASYGLENVLFPVGTDFIEIVSPTRPGTAAGRFLERHGGRHGYMVILDCDDPEARGRHCASIGVRTAHLIRHDRYVGVQLHPKDTSAAMIEFNRTEGGADATGLVAELDELDVEYREGLADCERRTIVTTHAAFGQLARRYGLTEVSLAGRSPEAEPSPRELEQLIEGVRASGATTVFAEPLVSDEVAKTVAREADVMLATLDPIEGLSQERLDAGEDYPSVMRDNLAALREALGCR